MSSEMPRIIKTFKATRYYRDTEQWELKKYQDGEVLLGVGGDLYDVNGVKNLIQGLSKMLKIMEKANK